MQQFSRMKMYTNYLADSYHHIFDRTPIRDWGYLYYDFSGRYLQLGTTPILLDDFFNKELYADQIMGDMKLISDQIYVSDIVNDDHLSYTLKDVLLNHDYTYFFDYMRRDIDVNNNFSMEVITFASCDKPFVTNNFLLNNIDVLNKICDDISHKCRRLLTKENTLILPPDFMINVNEAFTQSLQDPTLDLKAKLLESYDNSHTSKLALTVKDETFDFNLLPFSFLASKELTHKEKEVIYLYYFGFNSGRIAAILEISKRTVEKYFENIRKKLKCENTGQIIPTLLIFDNSLQTALRKT